MLVDWLGESSDSGDEHGKLSGHGRRLERNSERERERKWNRGADE